MVLTMAYFVNMAFVIDLGLVFLYVSTHVLRVSLQNCPLYIFIILREEKARKKTSVFNFM